ncbi:MAG: hypothetical protein K2X48_13825 [Chitinophagaceae bacterium]|nr:hypothetical protein [Chitinophagaceae bacterium]
MKQFIVLFLFVFVLASSKAGIISVPFNKIQNNASVSSFQQFMSTVTVQTFIELTPSKVQELTGYKMKFLEKAYFKLAQKKVKKQLRKGTIKQTDAVYEQFAKSENFNWGTFALCALLGPIGILIVYLSNYDDREVARRSAWRGLLTWAGIVAMVAYLLSV